MSTFMAYVTGILRQLFGLVASQTTRVIKGTGSGRSRKNVASKGARAVEACNKRFVWQEGRRVDERRCATP